MVRWPGDDQAFSIRDGRAVLLEEITIEIGEERPVIGAGATVFAPRDVPHGFTVTSTEPVHYLILYTPDGFEGFIVDSSRPAAEATLPPPPDSPPMQEQINELAAFMSREYACEFVA